MALVPIDQSPTTKKEVVFPRGPLPSEHPPSPKSLSQQFPPPTAPKLSSQESSPSDPLRPTNTPQPVTAKSRKSSAPARNVSKRRSRRTNTIRNIPRGKPVKLMILPDLSELRFGVGIAKSTLNRWEKATSVLFENDSYCSFQKIRKKSRAFREKCESHSNFVRGRQGNMITDGQTVLEYHIPPMKYAVTPIKVLANIIQFINSYARKRDSVGRLPTAIISSHSKRLAWLFGFKSQVKEGAVLSLENAHHNQWVVTLVHPGIRHLESALGLDKKDLDFDTLKNNQKIIRIPINRSRQISAMKIYFISSGIGFHRIAKSNGISRNNYMFMDTPLITSKGYDEIVELRMLTICKTLKDAFLTNPKATFITSSNPFLRRLRIVLNMYSSLPDKKDQTEKLDRILEQLRPGLSSHIKKFLGSYYQILVNAIFCDQADGEGQMRKIASVITNDLSRSRIKREWIFISSYLQRSIHSLAIIVNNMKILSTNNPELVHFLKATRILERNMSLYSNQFGEWLREFILSRATPEKNKRQIKN